MNIANNKRRKESKEKIKKAFIQLIQKSMSNIFHYSNILYTIKLLEIIDKTAIFMV